MISISHLSDRGLSLAFAEPVPTRMKVLSWNRLVDADLFKVGTVIQFTPSSNGFQAQWNDANNQSVSASFALHNGELGLQEGSQILNGFRVVLTISPRQDHPRQWIGTVTLDPGSTTGPSGTFIAEADPDPVPDPLPPSLG